MVLSGRVGLSGHVGLSSRVGLSGPVGGAAGGTTGAVGFLSDLLTVLLLGLCGAAQVLDGERPGRMHEGEQGALVGGLETTPLSRAQSLLGDLEVGQLQHRGTCAVQASLQAGGKGTHRRGTALLWGDAAQGVLEQATPLCRALGELVSTEQRLGLSALEPVLLHRAGHGLLLLGLQPAQRVGQAHPDSPLVHLARKRLTQPLGQREPLMHPGGLAPAAMRDALRAQLLLVP